MHCNEREVTQGSLHERKLCDRLFTDAVARLFGVVVICVIPALLWTWIAHLAAKALGGVVLGAGSLISIGLAIFAVLIVVCGALVVSD